MGLVRLDAIDCGVIARRGGGVEAFARRRVEEGWRWSSLVLRNAAFWVATCSSRLLEH
jgi:hypothetical protein